MVLVPSRRQINGFSYEPFTIKQQAPFVNAGIGQVAGTKLVRILSY
jgi:hypothetical protein